LRGARRAVLRQNEASSARGSAAALIQERVRRQKAKGFGFICSLSGIEWLILNGIAPGTARGQCGCFVGGSCFFEFRINVGGEDACASSEGAGPSWEGSLLSILGASFGVGFQRKGHKLSRELDGVKIGGSSRTGATGTENGQGTTFPLDWTGRHPKSPY
jgi:hypothetical protein